MLNWSNYFIETPPGKQLKMKTFISLTLAYFLLAMPATSLANPDWSTFLSDFSTSNQHQVVKLKIAEQTSFIISKIGNFVQEGLDSRLVRYGTFGMMTIVGLCMLFSIGDTEGEGNKENVAARRNCFSRRKRSITSYRPSERKRWIRKVKGKFRRQVQLG